MALAYRPPGVSVNELFSPAVNPLLAAPASVCLVGEAQGYIQRTDPIALTGSDQIALPNFPRANSILTEVISVTNVNEIEPYATGEYEVNYDSAANEVQTVTLAGTSSGDYKLTFQDEETADIAYNASAIAVESALEALSNVETADVAVTGDAGGPWTVTFAGQYADTDLDELTVNTAGLAGAAPAATVHTVVNGGVAGTVKRSNGSDIPEGATVTVVYRFLPDTYYTATRLDQQSAVEEIYGSSFDESGNLNSPVSLAAQIAFDNGARDLVIQALFRLENDADPLSVRNSPSDAEIQDTTTWEQAFYALRDIFDINVIVPVIGQSFPGLSDSEQLGIFQKLANHIEFMETEQQYMMAVVGEDSSASSSVAQATALRAHALTLRESRGGAVAENFIFASPAKFVRQNPRTNADFYVGGQYVAAGIAGMLASQPVATSITRTVVSGFTGVGEPRSKADKNTDAQNGLTVLEARGAAAIQVRHSITLDASSTDRREVPVVRAKHRMIESVRDTLETQIIGKVIADGEAPTVVASAVTGVLERLVSEKDLVAYRDVQARTLSYDPTTVEVRFSYKPAYPLNYVNIVFALDLTQGPVELV